MEKLQWTRILPPSDKERQDQFFNEMWLSKNSDFSLALKNLKGRIWCTLGFSADGDLPIAAFASRYSLHEERSTNEEASRRFPEGIYSFFTVVIQGKLRHVWIARDKKTLAAGGGSHDMTITDTPPF
jgi:hypothetical protein